jgi:hypothetical protein
MDMRSLCFGFLFLLAACGGSSTPVGDVSSSAQDLSDGPPEAHVHFQHGFSHGGGGGGGGNLIDHGGPVLASSRTYAIWWGSPTAFPSDAQAGINALFSGLNGTSFLGLTNQYMRGSSSSTSFVQDLSDGSAPPTRSPAVSTIVNEACRVINSNGLTADPSATYFVFTSTFPNHVSFCAWHSFGTCNGTTIQVAYMPNTTNVAGCDPGNQFFCNNYSQGTRSLANVTSHEFMEAITDPDLSAWFDSSGQENGDKCAWRFASCVNLTTGNWQLQEEWSNAVSGCAQQ